MLSVNQQDRARPVDTSLQLTWVWLGDDEAEVPLGSRGEAMTVEERRAAAAPARAKDLREECIVVDVFRRWTVRTLLDCRRDELSLLRDSMRGEVVFIDFFPTLLVEHVDFCSCYNSMGRSLPCEITNTPSGGKGTVL